MTKRIALVLAVTVLAACGTNTRQEIKEIDGQKFLCTWTETEINYQGTKKDYRCEAFYEEASTTTVP